MSLKTGYCISAIGDRLELVGVSEQGQGRWQVAECFLGQADAGPPADLVSTLTSRGKAQSVVTWLDRNDMARVNLTTLPKLKGAELARAVTGWVAREETLLPDQILADWQATGVESMIGKEPAQEYVLLHAEKEAVVAQQQRADEWGVPLQRLMPPSLVLDQFYRQTGQTQDKDQPDSWALVFVGQRDHFLCVANNNGLLLHRSLTADLSEGQDPQEYASRLATEVDRSIYFARQMEQRPNIEKIVVCCDAQFMPVFVEQLSVTSSLAVESWTPDTYFDWASDTPDTDLLLPLMTAALSLQKPSFNLLPKPPRTWLSPRVRRHLMLATGTVAAAAVPVLLIGGMVTSRVQEHYLSTAQERLAEKRVAAEAAAQIHRMDRLLLARETYMQSFRHTQPDLPGVLLSLADLTPKQVVFRDLQIQARNEGPYELHLTGESIANTVSEAQKSFLTLHAALKDCDFLILEGEPRQLEITVEDDEHAMGSKKVVFSLDCTIAQAQEGS